MLMLNLSWAQSLKVEKRSFHNVLWEIFVSTDLVDFIHLKYLPWLSGSLMQSGRGSVNTSCLVDPDPGRTVISLQMCGNGIVEAGEDCDPGIGTTSNCCDSATCKFINNALCDPQSSPCCTSQCTFAPSTQVCHPSTNDICDTAEFCTGNSSSCPPDVTAKNGTKIQSIIPQFGSLTWSRLS